MSRTFHHGDKAKERLWGNSHYRGRYPAKPTPPKRKRYEDHWHWMSTPSWWIREMMTRPQRAQVRQLTHKTMMLLDYEDAPLFPLAKKPHIYYW